MSTKRKHLTLTLNEKKDIIIQLDNGESSAKLARTYGVGRSTIYDIKVNRDKILEYVDTADGDLKGRKTVRTGAFPEMENALFRWFVKERASHTPLSGEILREKAKYFYEKLTKKNDFRASDGWLENFKKRFGIRFSCATREKLSSDSSDFNPFLEKFELKMEELDLLPEQVNSTDENEMAWEMLPHKRLEHTSEQTAGRKIPKRTLAIMPCADTTGSHKLPLLVVENSKEIRSPEVESDDFVSLTRRTVSNSEAFDAVNVCTRWAEENDLPSNEVLLLKRLQESIFDKMNNAKKQKPMNERFS